MSAHQTKLRPSISLRFPSRLLVVLAIILGPALVPPASCSPFSDAVITASDRVKVARRNLLVLPVHSLETNISLRAASYISQMKEASEKLVVTYLEGLPVNSIPDVKKIEDDLNKLIESRRILLDRTTPVEAESSRFGYEAWFEARVTSDERQLLQIISTFSIQCGQDSMLLIFEPNKKEKTWKEILNWQSAPYKAVYKALNIFQYAISPSDSQGKWYVLGADNPAHCSSCWGVQRYYILRPNDNSTRPIIQFKDWGTLYECGGPAELAAYANDFDVRFEGRGIQVEDPVRPHICHYDLKNGRFVRTQPVANTARDFVDEWITAPWKEASMWCLLEDCEELKMEHEALQEIANKSGDLKFGAAQQLRRSPQLTQVELWDSNAAETDPSWYFSIKRESNKFTMMQITRRARVKKSRSSKISNHQRSHSLPDLES